MKPALAILPFVLILPGCRKPEPVPPAPSYAVKVESDPSPAILSFQEKQLGRTPAIVLLGGPDEVPLVKAEYQGQAPVEQRVRYLPDGKVEVSFLFGEGRSALAKALGLARILVFEYSAGLTFDVNKAELKTSTLPLLQRQAALLKGTFKDIPIIVCGHTDSTGSPDHNLALSVQRAKAVLEYLASQGVAADRLRPQGFADAYPLAPNATEEGRSLNRRTEVVLGR